MVYGGIDPGKHGGLAIIITDDTGSGSPVHLVTPYDKDLYIEYLAGAAKHDNLRLCLERVSAMPGNGSVSMFNFGVSFGWLQGLLDAYRISYELVRPQTWKKEFGVTKDKNTSIEVCRRLFPDVNLIQPSCRKPHDGCAEALLMAEYARRKL